MINIKLSDLLEARPSRNQLVDEQELRLFLIPKNGGGQRNNSQKAEHRDIKITWKDVIKKVRVDKNCSEAELVAITRACFYVGINPKFIKYRPNVNTSQSNPHCRLGTNSLLNFVVKAVIFPCFSPF